MIGYPFHNESLRNCFLNTRYYGWFIEVYPRGCLLSFSSHATVEDQRYHKVDVMIHEMEQGLQAMERSIGSIGLSSQAPDHPWKRKWARSWSYDRWVSCCDCFTRLRKHPTSSNNQLNTNVGQWNCQWWGLFLISTSQFLWTCALKRWPASFEAWKLQLGNRNAVHFGHKDI